MSATTLNRRQRFLLWLYSVEGAALVRSMRCFWAQGIMRALLWIALISGAGYAAFKVNTCPPGVTCVQPEKMKAKR